MSGTFNINQINVNVTDVIPPDNFATVDAGSKIGTVYTKAQDNEWRAEVEATTQSGIKGVLKPNTPYDAVTNPYPTPWAQGDSPLYEKYDVNQAGPFPNTKDPSDENIIVTQNDLDLNEVQIWIKNGVAQKVLKAMPQASVNIRKWEDLQPNDFPLNEGNQVVTDDGLFIVPEGKTAGISDIPGESSNYKSLGKDGNVNSVLKWFLEQETQSDTPLKTYPITEISSNPTLFGIDNKQGVILQKDNTLIIPAGAGGVQYNVFQNLPIGDFGIKKIKLKIIPYINNSPNHCTLLGMSQLGAITTLIMSENPNSLHDYEFDVSNFHYLSFGFVTVNTLPDSFLQQIEFYRGDGEVVQDIVKDYIDEEIKNITIYTNRTLYPLKYGFKETNTEAENRAILNGLITLAFNEARSIELPEGKYPISNVSMKPCNLYGKDRNTMLESKTAEPMFIMEPQWGQANIDNHTTAGFAGGYYTGFEVAGFGLKGNGIATKGFWLSKHAFAHYDRLFFHGFSDVAMQTEGMLICTFGDIEIRQVQNGIRATMLGQYAANLVCFDYLNIEGCRGVGVDWRNGSAIHIKRLDTEKIGTVGDLNTGSLFFDNIPPEYNGMMGVTIDKSWAEDINGGFYAKLNGNAIHAIRDTNILKLSSDAQNSIINNGGKLLLENVSIEGSFGLVTSNGGQTLCQGFNKIPLHTELTGGTFKTAQYL